MNPINRAYLSILLEEVLTDTSLIESINSFPSPLKDYFNSLRLAMLKAASAKTDEELTIVNTEVNKHRDELIKFWMKNSSKFKPISNKVNSVLMSMITRYSNLMGGLNTGYADVV